MYVERWMGVTECLNLPNTYRYYTIYLFAKNMYVYIIYSYSIMYIQMHIYIYIYHISVCAQSLCTPSYPEEHLSLLSVHHFRGSLDQGAYDDEMPDVFACRQCVLQLNLPANPSPLSRREKQCQDNGRNIFSNGL